MRKVLFILLPLMLVALTAVAANDKFTLVIDAGHGGHDHGAPGTFSEEKNLTLKFALAFGKLVEANCPDVNVVYTRKTDVFIPLYRRAEIANNAKADLFISVHINAVEGSRQARGFQSYTLGRGNSTGDRGLKQNIEVARRENAVIFMEKDYKTMYKGLNNGSAESDILFEFISDNNRERSVELSKLMQQEVCAATGRANGGAHQNNLAVLRLTSMPAVLLELGFISTLDEEQYMNSDTATDAYAKGIFNAFVMYKNKYDGNLTPPFRQGEPQLQPIVTEQTAERGVENQSISTRSDNRKSVVTSKQTVKDDEDKPVFKIQILTSGSPLRKDAPQFKGEDDVDSYEENGLIKYTCGADTNYNRIYRLRKQLLDKFPDAFIVAFKNNVKMDVNQAIREYKQNR